MEESVLSPNESVANSASGYASAQSPELCRKLNSIDKEISEIEKLRNDYLKHDVTSVLNDVLCEVQRRRRAFDSKLFFVIAFGMLKAGKSTLVNTFIGKKVYRPGT